MVLDFADFRRKKGSKDKKKRKPRRDRKKYTYKPDEIEDTSSRRKENLQNRREDRKSIETGISAAKGVSREARGWAGLLRGFFGK